MRGWCLAMAAMLALALEGCSLGGGPETYALNPAELRDKLAASDLPLDMLSYSNELHARATKLGDGSLSWSVSNEQGRSLFRIVVKIIDVDGGSQFDIEIIGATAQAEAGLNENPSFRSHIAEFAREHCDAVLDGRSYDQLRSSARTLPPNASENASVARNMDAAGEAHQRKEAANIERAYRQEPNRNPWN
jgi:hypothetical protein